MSRISITKLYDNLSPSSGKENAENVTTYIDYKVSIDMENTLKIVATKEDLHNEVSRLDNKFNETKVDLITKISETKEDLITLILKTNVSHIKWMVGICLVLGLMLMGLYFKK